MNKTLLEGGLNNKRIKTTESLQKLFLNGSKNYVIEIEKLMHHHSAAKKHIIFRLTMFFSNYFFIFLSNMGSRSLNNYYLFFN